MSIYAENHFSHPHTKDTEMFESKNRKPSYKNNQEWNQNIKIEAAQLAWEIVTALVQNMSCTDLLEEWLQISVTWMLVQCFHYSSYKPCTLSGMPSWHITWRECVNMWLSEILTQFSRLSIMIWADAARVTLSFRNLRFVTSGRWLTYQPIKNVILWTGHVGC